MQVNRRTLLIFIVVAATALIITSISIPGITRQIYYERQENRRLSIYAGNVTWNATKKETSQETHFHVDELQDIYNKNMTPDQIGRLQQHQVDMFCKIYRKKSMIMEDRQMLVNDEAKTAFCSVPKSGCTTLKVAFLLTLHALPSYVIRDKSKSPQSKLLLKAMLKHSLLEKNKAEKENIFKSYFKFVMYRNPVERLVSGYLSKIYGHPMIGLKSNQPERNWIRLKTYELVHPIKFKKWKQRGAKEAITISFPDFIQYWIKTGGIKIDYHFRTIFDLCSPCKIRYSYYGNFNTYAKDVGVLNDRIHGNMSYLLNPSARSMGPTISVAPKFYSEITDRQKKEIINILATDLHFYYTLFPAERGSHKAIMGVDYDIPRL